MVTTEQTPGTTDVVVGRKREWSHEAHARFLRIALSERDVGEFSTALRRALRELTSVSFVAHLRPGESGQLQSLDELEGNLSAKLEPDQLAALAQVAATRKTTIARTLNGFQILCSPIDGGAASPVVLCVGFPGEAASSHHAIYVLELAAAYQTLWIQSNASRSTQWKLNSLAAIIELVTAVEQHDELAGACVTAANEVAKFVGCAQVAIGTVREPWWAVSDNVQRVQGERQGLRARTLVVQSISGVQQFEPHSEVAAVFREAMVECLVTNQACRWQSDSPNSQGLRAHATLARINHYRSITSIPLETTEGKLVGVWLFADIVNPDSDRVSNFIRAASPRLSSAMEAVQRSERGVLPRLGKPLIRLARHRKSQFLLLFLLSVCGLLALPLPYQVRCRCVVESASRRYAVAPFRGMVEATLVESGDRVRAGETLAKMEGRELRLELSSTLAKQRQAERDREVKLTERSVSNVIIAQLEVAKLESQLSILRHRMDHLAITSPVDGVILKSTMEKGQTAPVEKGDVLYEIGSLDELRIEVEIPANEIPQIQVGQPTKVWLDGFETEPLHGHIEHLETSSQLRRDLNVFVGRFHVSNKGFRLRPGMRGSVRVSGRRHALAWNLFHKPWEYLCSRFSRW